MVKTCTFSYSVSTIYPISGIFNSRCVLVTIKRTLSAVITNVLILLLPALVWKLIDKIETSVL